MLDNLHFANQVGGRKRQANAEELIDVLGISHLLKRYPDTLSGGESQRVALGRAILAADEARRLANTILTMSAGAITNISYQ